MNKIASNFVAVLFGNFSNKLILFFINIYIANRFSTEQFGIVNFCTVFVSYFLMLANMGTQNYAVLELSKIKVSVEKIGSQILNIRLIFSIISYLLLIIIVYISKFDHLTKVGIILSGLTIIFTSFNISWIFNAFQDMKHMSISLFIQNFVAFIFILLIIEVLNMKSINIVNLSYSIGTLCSSIYLFIIFKRKYGIRLHQRLDLNQSKRIINQSIPFFFSGIFATINCNIDIILIGVMLGNQNVGLYSAAYKIINVLLVVSTIIFTPLYPVIIRLFSQKDKKLYKILYTTKKVIYSLAIPLIMVSFSVSKKIISTFYKSEYYTAHTVLSILLIYVGVFFVREFYGYQLSAFSLQKKYMKIVLVSSSVNIIMNIILIPRFGYQVAAITTLISEIINLFLMRYIVNKIIKVKLETTIIIKITISSIIVLLFINLILKMNIFIIFMTSVVIFVGLLFALKVFSILEIKQLIIKEK